MIRKPTLSERPSGWQRWTDPKGVLLLFILGLVLRLGVWAYLEGLNPSGMIQPDSPGYVSLAESLRRGDGFSRMSPDGHLIPEVRRTPGYPAFLSAIGWNGPSFDPSRATLVQAVFLTGIIAISVALAWVSGGVTAAAITAGFMAIDPTLLIHDLSILTDSPFTLLITMGVAMAWLATSRGAIGLAILSGALLGVGILTRPIGLFFPPLVALWVVLSRRRGKGRRPVLAGLLLLSAAYLPTAGWIYRNQVKAGAPVLSEISSINLYRYRAADALARTTGRRFEAVQDSLIRIETEEVEGSDLGTRIAWRNKESRRILLENPSGFLESYPVGAAQMLAGPGRESARHLFGERASGYVVVWSGILLGLMWIGVLLFLLSIRNQPTEVWPLLVLWVVYFVAVSAGPEAYSRFRVPIIPPLSILAGLGWAQAWSRSRWERVRAAPTP